MVWRADASVRATSEAPGFTPDSVAVTGEREPGAQRLQEAPANPWNASLHYTYESLTDGRVPWQMVQGFVGRRFSGGAVVLEGAGVERFDRWDAYGALDSYLDVWPRAYANVRLQAAPAADFLPTVEVSGDLYQSFGRAWEAVAGYRWRHYEAEDIHFLSLGLGLYAGRWYLRERTTVFPFQGKWGASVNLAARRYWNAPLEYLELTGGVGRGIETIEAGPVIAITRTYFLGVHVQKFVTPHVGFTVFGGYADDQFFQRRTISAGVLTRW